MTESPRAGGRAGERKSERVGEKEKEKERKRGWNGGDAGDWGVIMRGRARR